MHTFYDVIDIDNYVSFNALQNFISENIYLFSDQFDSYHVKPNIVKIFTTHFILITKHLNLNWNIVKSLFFSQKKRLLLNEIFQICYLFQTSTLCPV